jgi:hypothetical protein
MYTAQISVASEALNWCFHAVAALPFHAGSLARVPAPKIALNIKKHIGYAGFSAF